MKPKERRPRRAQQHPRPHPVRIPVLAPVSALAPTPALDTAPAEGIALAAGQRADPAQGPLPDPAAAESSSAAKRSEVLHREDRCDPLPRCPSAARVCGRARQDRAPAAHRCMHHAPAPPDPRHQAGQEHRPAAVCNAALSCRPQPPLLAAFVRSGRIFFKEKRPASNASRQAAIFGLPFENSARRSQGLTSLSRRQGRRRPRRS